MKQVGGPLIRTARMAEAERKRVERWSQDGRLRRIYRGVYLDEQTYRRLDEGQRTRVWIVARAMAWSGAVVVGRSAAQLWGLPLDTTVRQLPVELAGPHRVRGRRDRSLVTRQSPKPGHTQLLRTDFGEVRVTTPARTGLDLARWHTPEDAVTALDHGVRRGLTTFDRLDITVGDLAGHPGAGAARRVLDLVTPWSESPRESSLKVRMWRAGLPAPVQQANLYDERGDFLGRVDFFYPEIGLAVEYDGEGKYRGEFGLDPLQSIQDSMLRQNELLRAGVALIPVDRESYRDGTAVRAILRAHEHLSSTGRAYPAHRWNAAGRAWR